MHTPSLVFITHAWLGMTISNLGCRFFLVILMLVHTKFGVYYPCVVRYDYFKLGMQVFFSDLDVGAYIF